MFKDNDFHSVISVSVWYVSIGTSHTQDASGMNCVASIVWCKLGSTNFSVTRHHLWLFNFRFNQLVKNNEALTGEEYKAALSNLVDEHPDILDCDGNTFAVEILEEEVSMFLDIQSQTNHKLAVTK